jgi:hypothetical protein
MYIFGLAATLLGVIGALPYIYNAYFKKTRPHRFAWLIYLILSLINFTSQFSLGARASLIFFGWVVVNNVILFSLSLRKNGGYGDVNTVNVVCFILALLSILLWKTTNSPFLALVFVLIADGIGSILIAIKSYHHPETETKITWTVGIICGFLNILAVGKIDVYLLAAPLYIFIFNIIIIGAILLGENTLKSKRK